MVRESTDISKKLGQDDVQYKQSSLIEQVKSRLKKSPYTDAIDSLRKIQKINNPAQKLDVLVQI